MASFVIKIWSSSSASPRSKPFTTTLRLSAQRSVAAAHGKLICNLLRKSIKHLEILVILCNFGWKKKWHVDKRMINACPRNCISSENWCLKRCIWSDSVTLVDLHRDEKWWLIPRRTQVPVVRYVWPPTSHGFRNTTSLEPQTNFPIKHDCSTHVPKCSS